MDEVQNSTTTKAKAMTSSTFIKHNMLVDPSIQKEIIKRAIDGKFGDNPNQAVYSLGSVKMPDGREVPVYLRHAADAVLLDDFGHVVLITRKHNPGAGRKALPGGVMDPVQGIDGAVVGEKAATAVLREATEETGISRRLLEEAQIIPVGHRSYNRPFDIRVAWGDMPGTDIKKGDFFGNLPWQRGRLAMGLLYLELFVDGFQPLWIASDMPVKLICDRSIQQSPFVQSKLCSDDGGRTA